MTTKWTCDECDWAGTKYLTLLNTFDGSNIVICPKCKSAESLQEACDEPGCWKYSTCGFPTPAGYRRTCGVHYAEAIKKGETT